MSDLFNSCGLPSFLLPGSDDSIRIGKSICCNGCCFPHLLANECDAQKIWPLSRYLAILDSEPCNGCGRCVSRCPFDAIHQEKKFKGRPAAPPVVDKHRWRGCGICATGCPQAAIDMQKVNTSTQETFYA
jgi:heterodisulfide reductase subunit A-like polyferredoxin